MTTAVPGAEDGRADASEDGPADGLLAGAFELLPDAVSISVAVRVRRTTSSRRSNRSATWWTYRRISGWA
ncbi:hypothetical protein ACWDNT_33890, partial [Streptomyces sp. NPDC000963]